LIAKDDDLSKEWVAPYAATKAAIVNFSGALAQLLVLSRQERSGRRSFPPRCPREQVKSFGQNVPLGRAGQPTELAPVYVLLASPEAAMSRAVTGSKPIIL
jgi:NAD(P)-dependent dehydrogenase (short-subunit alcohol dehydrogenase family)